MSEFHDADVKSAELALAKALLARITSAVRTAYPTARNVHSYRSDFTHGHVAWKVLGPNGRVLWNRDEEVDYMAAPYSLDSDIALYVTLRPPWLGRLASGHTDYSIRLLPKSLGTRDAETSVNEGRQ